MNYLYHIVPVEMRGDILYPLNILKEKHSDLYKKQASKYVGRENIIQQKIPILNCLWNDVLHFSVVHPSIIKEALFESGHTKPFNIEFFEIDPNILDIEKTIIYLYKYSDMKDKLKEDNFAKYNPDNIAQYSNIPQETKEYYKEIFSQGKNPLLFHMIPHIFYRGSLDISKVKKVR